VLNWNGVLRSLDRLDVFIRSIRPPNHPTGTLFWPEIIDLSWICSSELQILDIIWSSYESTHKKWKVDGRIQGGIPNLTLQVDRNLMLYLPRLTVLVTIEADRPGAWFPGPLGPYQAWFPAICPSRDFKPAKVPGNPMKTPFCFGVFWGVIFKKKLFSRVDSRIT